MNAGVGLLTPFGGQEGYKAVIPSDEDPSKTDNALAEVAAKYILGRIGGLLPWDEFKKVGTRCLKTSTTRSARHSSLITRETSIHLTMDRWSFLQVLSKQLMKASTDTVQFLGKSLPLATAVLPTTTAILGTALGARGPRGGPTRGLLAGTGSMLAGMGIGNAIENERRRRNAEENQGIQSISRI